MAEEMNIYEDITAYGKAYSRLWEHVQENPDQFPSGSISVGTIAEYYAKKFLEEKHRGSRVSFGRANEKSWDIQVLSINGEKTLYQVKSISLFNKTRKLSPLVEGFDSLIVISMDCEFMPFQVYLFEDSKVLFGENKVTALTVPNPENKRQRGSEVFLSAKNIHHEFFELLSNKL